MEFRRDKVLGRMEALSSGAESLVSSWLLGLPDWSWGAKVNCKAVTPNVTSAMYLQSFVSAYLGKGCLSVSTGCRWVGSGDKEEVWSGVGQDWSLIGQGAKEGRGGSERRAAFPELCFRVLKGCPSVCTFEVTGSCGCAGTLFSPQSDPQALEDCYCLSGKNVAAAWWEAT